jgi:cell division protein FtsB
MVRLLQGRKGVHKARLKGGENNGEQQLTTKDKARRKFADYMLRLWHFGRDNIRNLAKKRGREGGCFMQSTKRSFFSRSTVILSCLLAISLGFAAACYVVYDHNLAVTSDMEYRIEQLKEENTKLRETIEELRVELNELSGANERLRQLSSRSGGARNQAPHSISGLTVEQINGILANTSLAGTGESWAAFEQEYNVNSVFAIAVMALESGWGRSRANTHNYFGFRLNGRWMAFDSQQAGIEYFYRLISRHYSHLTTLETIGNKYAPCSNGGWAPKVRQLMGEVERRAR